MESHSLELFKYISDELKNIAGISTKNSDLSNLDFDDDMMGDSLDADDPDAEILQTMISKGANKELNISQLQALMHVVTKVDDVDEFCEFHMVMEQIKVIIKTSNPKAVIGKDVVMQYLGTLDPKKQSLILTAFRSKRITTNDNSTVPREIFQRKRKNNQE